MESKKTQNRHSLACKFCLRTQETLTVHLRRACKRDADAEEIELLMQEAKAKMRSILKGLSVVKYEDLDYKDSDPLDFFVNFLEKNGCYVRGKPEKSASSPMEERIRPSDINRTKVNLNRAADKVVERQAPFKDLDLSHKKTKPVHEKEVETQGPVKVLDLSVRSHKKTKPSPVNAEKVQRHRPIAEQPDHPMESEEEDIVGPVNEKEVETRGSFKKLDIPIESEEEDIAGPVNQKEVETRGPFKKLDIPVESDKENHAGPSTDDNDDDENPKKLDQSKTESHLILLKKKMKAAGMYRKHSLECDLLVSFRTFLQQELRVRRWSQEVGNVARFLYFVDPSKPSLKFLDDTPKAEKAVAFFTELASLGNSHATQFTYLKHIKRFVRSQMNTLTSSHQSKETVERCKLFLKMTEGLQGKLSKGISAETVGKKYDYMTSGKKDPVECQRILAVARPTIEQLIKKAKMGGTLLDKEKCVVLYYLEAIVVLKQLQRPGVVQNMTVEEWRNRKLSDCKTRMAIAVKKHKTATQQVATVLLEEEQWFDVFYKKIRPSFVRSGTSPKTFFISSSGEPIHSVTNDIARLHQKFNLRPVTSQEARRRMETYMASHLKTDAERYSFAKMLGHSNLTAERVYREKTIENMVEAAEVMKKALYGPQASTSRFKQMPQQPLETESTVVSRDLRENAFERFKQARPVTHDANPPCLKAALAFSHEYGQYCYDRWRKLQNKMRVDYVAGIFKYQKPNEERVRECIEGHAWKTN
ncbi:mesendoderm nuclear factor, gene 1 L homeolog [Xenopus laevis]|uniref:Mesendoderm nuclear factor n=1 Tax=Xenopus laevis TaxID=8355 RepID=Q8AV59_XENLA|nr:mesendoderm nuclear factor, gene 1 L homeolog [Xenopus laevis]AAN05640.1 mesendoderm nuclear factor [Xenopus laevis]